MNNCAPIRIALNVAGSHVPSFKNTKMMARGRLITDPKKQRWMERCIQDFVMQLSCAFPTGGTATQTGASRRCLTALCAQFDDSRHWLPESEGYMCVEVEKGMEGATITFEEMA